MLKKISALVLILALITVMLTACGGAASPKGTWKLTGFTGADTIMYGMSMDDINAFGVEILLTITDNSVTTTISALGEKQEETLECTITATEIIVDGSPVAYTVKGKTLTLTQDGSSVVFTKK